MGLGQGPSLASSNTSRPLLPTTPLASPNTNAPVGCGVDPEERVHVLGARLAEGGRHLVQRTLRVHKIGAMVLCAILFASV